MAPRVRYGTGGVMRWGRHGAQGALRQYAYDCPVAGNADLVARLHARGLRMTPQREQVLAAVRQLEHATPEQISDSVTDVDVTTVYRTLELLEQLGLVRHTHLGHGAPSFRPAEDDHVHVVCHECGQVIDAPHDLIDALSTRLESERGFTVDRSHFTVFGRCADCTAKDTPETDSAPSAESAGNHDPQAAPHVHASAPHVHASAPHVHGSGSHTHPEQNNAAGR
jgi:Fur family ferric uptake transcriptional regulator